MRLRQIEDEIQSRHREGSMTTRKEEEITENTDIAAEGYAEKMTPEYKDNREDELICVLKTIKEMVHQTTNKN